MPSSSKPNSIDVCEGDDPTIDGCAIPLGCIESAKRLKE